MKSQLIQWCICRLLEADPPAKGGLAEGAGFVYSRPDFLHLSSPICQPARTTITTTTKQASLIPTTRDRTRNRSAPEQENTLDSCAYFAPPLNYLATHKRRDDLADQDHIIVTAIARLDPEENRAMSMVATRSPLTVIGMNGAGATAPRRSARLSVEGQDDSEPPSKRVRTDGPQNAGSTKENGAGKRTRGKGKTSRFPRHFALIEARELRLIDACSLR